MIDSSTIDAGKVKMTTRMICDEATKRGWKAEMYSLHSSFIRLTRSDGKVLRVYSAIPPTTSFASAKASDDKYITQMIMSEAGLPALASRLVGKDDDVDGIIDGFTADAALAVKPLDSSHGKGVSVNVKGNSALADALATAFQFSEIAIVQEFIEEAIDIRLACINYHFVAGLIRQPAGVVGDGLHSIRQLIDIENKQDYRGLNYTRRLNSIDALIAEKYLGKDIETIPAAGQRVPVVGTANVGTGGETHDITDTVPEWLVEMAEKAARVMNLPVCGVDFLIKSIPSKQMTEQELGPVIIEINKGPSLFIHETPTHGQARPVIAAYVDYLEKL